MPKISNRYMLPSDWAEEIAARVWCDPEMSKINMDTSAAIEIAQILDEVKGNQEIANIMIDSLEANNAKG